MEQREPEQLPAARAVRLLVEPPAQVHLKILFRNFQIFSREDYHVEVEWKALQGEGPVRDLEQRRGGADCHEAEAVAQGDAAAEVGVGDGHHAVASAGVVGPQVPRQTESWKIFSVSKNIFSNLITPSPLGFY